MLAPTIAAEERTKTPAIPLRGIEATRPILVCTDPRLAVEKSISRYLFTNDITTDITPVFVWKDRAASAG